MQTFFFFFDIWIIQLLLCFEVKSAFSSVVSSLVFMLREHQSNEPIRGVRDEVGLPGAPAPTRVSGVSVLTPSRPPHPGAGGLRAALSSRLGSRGPGWNQARQAAGSGGRGASDTDSAAPPAPRAPS